MVIDGGNMPDALAFMAKRRTSSDAGADRNYSVRICLLRFPKIPFTCSWLPGKSRMNMALLAALGLALIGRDAASFERQALQDTRGAVSMIALLAFFAIGVRRTA